MNVGELKEILANYPDDMDIWVSDQGMLEGATKLVSVKKLPAYIAGLDLDDLDDEFIYATDIPEDALIEYKAKGYTPLHSVSEKFPDVILSKMILLLHDVDE